MMTLYLVGNNPTEFTSLACRVLTSLIQLARQLPHHTLCTGNACLCCLQAALVHAGRLRCPFWLCSCCFGDTSGLGLASVVVAIYFSAILGLECNQDCAYYMLEGGLECNGQARRGRWWGGNKLSQGATKERSYAQPHSQGKVFLGPWLRQKLEQTSTKKVITNTKELSVILKMRFWTHPETRLGIFQMKP